MSKRQRNLRAHWGRGRKLTLKKVNAKVDKIKRAIEIKEKYKTVAEGALDGDKGILINDMQKGDNNGQRESNKIQMKYCKIQLRFQITDQDLDGTETTTPWTLTSTDNTRVRVILIINRQNNLSNVFDVSEILRDSTNTVTRQNSQLNYDFVGAKGQKNKYRVLYDKSFQFNPIMNGSDRLIKINRTLNMNTIFSDADNGTGLDIIGNKVELLIFPERLGTMRFAYTSVLFYTDS